MRIRAHGSNLLDKAIEGLDRHCQRAVAYGAILLNVALQDAIEPSNVRGCGLDSRTLASADRGKHSEGKWKDSGHPAWLQSFQQLLGFLESRESLFRLPELASVDPAPHAMVIHGITQVKHLVEHHIFERQRRRGRIIENTSDDNSI